MAGFEGAGGGGDVATDTLWAATGDLAVATGDDTATVLTIGDSSAVLNIECGTPAWTTTPSLTGLTATGDITTTGAAIDWDLKDDCSSALSFDSACKAGILTLVTTNCSEGVTMSGTLGVTGAVTATGGLTVGSDGSGADVTFHSATGSDNLLWDASCEKLVITGTNGQTALCVADGNVVIVDTLYFADVGGEYISSNGSVLAITGATTVSSTLGVTGAITANAGVVVDNFTLDGTELDLSTGNFTLDVAGDIEINADGGCINFKDADLALAAIVNTSCVGELRIHEAANFVGFKTPALTGDTTYTLPAAYAGSNGMALTSTTGGVMSWAAAGGGAFTLIETKNITSSTGTADFECLSGYCTYFLHIANAVPVACGPYAVMQLGCASCCYHESNTDYGWVHYGIHAHPTSSPIHTAFLGSTCSTETSWIVLYRRGVGGDTGEGFSGNIWISSRACQRPRIHGTFAATSYLAEASGGIVVGEYRSVITMDRVRFKFHSNSIESGRLSMYGVSHA